MELDAADAGRPAMPSGRDTRQALLHALLNVGTDDPGWPDAVPVAAVARQVDARMLAAVRPELDGEAAEQWLRRRPYAELRSRGVAVNDELRRALITHLEETDPLGLADIRIALADHLYHRALDGERGLLPDISELIREPQMRSLLMPPSTTLRLSRPRPGDRDALQARLGHLPSWPILARWFDDVPHSWALIRNADDALCGSGLIVLSHDAPDWIDDDPVLGPWIRHAASQRSDGQAAFLRESHVFGDPADIAFAQTVVGTGNHHLATEMERYALRYAYVSIDARDTATRAALEHVGYRRLPELDAHAHGEHRLCMRCDYGPAGVIGWGRDLVHLSHGRPAPSTVGAPGADPQAVRAALRAFHDATALAANPLAIGIAPEERAEQLRERLRRATSAAFGERPSDQADGELIRLAYLEPIGGHDAVMLRLHLSRATYFRRLASAVDRIARHLADTY